jgi:starch synthase
VPRLSGRSPTLHVLLVASEATPWAKTGGLADVAGALPSALAERGHYTTLVMPRYRGIDVASTTERQLHIRRGETRSVNCHVRQVAERQRVVFVDVPEYFDRAGLYGEAGRDYADNARRFDLLGLAALEVASADEALPPPDVLHAHDWQACTAILRLRLERRWPRLAATGTVLTIHNLAYQGLFPQEVVPALQLPWESFRMDRGEFWGQFSFLKAGITSADSVTTVSPTYAAETLTPESGAGLEGVLRSLGDRYLGILNGIDTNVWNPETDPLLPANFSANDLAGKAECKRALLGAFGLPRGDDAIGRPLVGMVSRLVQQKGLDLIEQASGEMVELDAGWVFLGSGDRRYERFLLGLAAAHPTRVGVHIGFDERLAHLVEAGADVFLMPSEFEPCGLNQMYSLRYGTVPIVRAVGGLDDTIQPYTAHARHANGFKFKERSGEVLAQVARRATRLYHNRQVWRRLMRNGMAADHSWAGPAREYVKVYRRVRADGAARARESSAGSSRG